MGAFRWAWLLVAGLALNATAGDIYVCKGANGVNSYQNTPCPTPAAEIRHNTYDPALGRPGAVSPEAEAPVDQRAVYGTRSPTPLASDRGTYQAPPPPEIAAYRCTAGQRTWIQPTPCPATYEDSAFVGINGHLADGTMMHGTGFVPTEKRVQQSTLDHDAMCDQVRTGARIGQGGGSSASQSYERNKIKRNQCGG